MKQALFILLIILVVSCERKPEISFEKMIETSVNSISQEVSTYLNNSDNENVEIIKGEISLNKEIIESLNEVDTEFSLKKLTISYFDLLLQILNKSQKLSLNEIEDQKEMKELLLNVNYINDKIKYQLKEFCKKHQFEYGLSIYDLDNYEEALKKQKG